MRTVLASRRVRPLHVTLPLVAALCVAACVPPAARGETGVPTTPLFEPPAHTDPIEGGAGPLDLTSVTFGQRATELVLRVTTAAPWTAADLAPVTGRSICLQLFYGVDAVAPSRVCVNGGDALTISYTPAGQLGQPVRPLLASISRPDSRSVTASFGTNDAALPLGPFRWRVRTSWTDAGDCGPEKGCGDWFPQTGTVPSRTVLLARPPCFGAAARAPGPACSNPRLDHTIVPALPDAPLQTNEPCLPVGRPGSLDLCEFRDPPRDVGQDPTFALIGDSHAGHWRAGLNVFARARGWRGISMSRTACPFSTAAPRKSAAQRRDCESFRGRVLRYIAEHPEIRMVFISNNDAGRIEGPPGADGFEAEVAGVSAALRLLPASLPHVVVIRDPPGTSSSTVACLERTLRHHQPTRGACSTPRDVSLTHHDPAAVAVTRMQSRRMTVFDMTKFFCDRRRCFPVIGGALVHKDLNHLTATYSQTLGPFLLERIDKLLGMQAGGGG